MVRVRKASERLTANFNASEFRCRCRNHGCTAPPMDPAFMIKIQKLRDAFGKPLVINSGSRCALWNKSVSGSPTSQHLLGRAADIHLDSPTDGPRLALMAEKIGFGGIGVGKTFVHIDIGPQGRRWTYDY